MAFILTPRMAPAYQAPQCNPFGYCAPVSPPSHGYRVSRPQPRRPQYSPYNNFFSQVDELLSEIDREAQREAQRQAQIDAHREALREAYRQRQLQRKRALRAEFQVNQIEHGWQVDGDIKGFEQDNINIEVIDEQTLKIAGNTEWQSEKSQPQPQQAQIEAEPTPASHDEQPTATQSQPEVETTTEAETTASGAATPDSDTASHKSYQPTVEDDFDDLAADFPSSRPASPTEPREPKGKERAVEEPVSTETAVVTQPQAEVPVQQPQQQPQQQQRVHGSFERTFKFPERIDVANVSASFKDGALKVTVPKAQAPQIRRIAIL
jgi:HSP20 family molecular chaperone IbpA